MVPENVKPEWQGFRNACLARTLPGLQDRALAVLNALLTFCAESELWTESGLIVFPSKAQLTARANGISGATLRRAIASLIEAGLIERHDSPNGKRYAHRDKSGQVKKAFGFSLAPLVVRASELALKADQVSEETRKFRRAKEALSICRRDVRKLITTAMEEGLDGDWVRMEAIFVMIVSRIPRNATRLDLEAILEEMTMLREETLNLLEVGVKAQNLSTNDSQNDCHKQNSNTESNFEFEPCSENEQGANDSAIPSRVSPPTKAFPLPIILQACPEIVNFGPAGSIDNWRELMLSAVTVRSMLGISPSAYEDACDVMGQENVAVVVACILERAGEINSAGGYLRDLTARAKRGEFSLGQVLMALLRSDGQRGGRAA
ncbi:plasmid replication protein RepC [Brucella pituitosa]|uniref:plasmid replication protein RepC n=1 Tax=Brucella pituitosa TaxID=571256 RepID=UPI0009A1FB7F|nr:plasmid replication protein RepC [Brucella pituitosa]